MANDGFNEVQFSAKQLVFLFMAAVVVAGAIFLTGVVTGRNIRSRNGLSVATDPAGQVAGVGGAPATGSLPPTTTTASDAGYQKLLTGDAKKPAEPPAPPAETAAQAAAARRSGSPPPPATGRAASSGSGTPDKNAAPPKPVPAPPSSAGLWFVQLGVFSKRSGAEDVVASLKAKGFAGFVTASAPYHVQLGPYDKAEANQVKARLATAGFTSILKPK